MHNAVLNSPFDTTDSDALLRDLTEAQREAAMHTHGPLLILAAAGSGKTRVITRRIARLIGQGVAPWRILALTFTNKAAGEMRQRVADLLDPGENALPPRGLTVTTFHALCARLLRQYAPIADIPGLGADFSIYDASDQLALMKRVIKSLDLSTSNWRPRSILSAISNAKNELKDAQAVEAEASDFYSRTIAKLHASYENALRKANAVDFDDLLLMTVQMLTRCAQAREAVQSRWLHVMIDEYQDTNKAQFTLASLIAPNPGGEEPNICVVGDPDQSIYGWRGADIRNIMEFEEHYPSARVIALGQNFRSTAPILATADALIRNNKQRKHKELFTKREGGDRPEVVLCRDERHEAKLVTQWLTKQRNECDTPWREMAVFYRTNALSRIMEDELRRSGAPYVIARGTAFYEREEVKDALAHLKLLANSADEVSLRRIVNKPARGIGAKSLSCVECLASEQDATLPEALRIAASGDYNVDLTARARGAMTRFLTLFDDWRQLADCSFDVEETPLSELVKRVISESGLEAHYSVRKGKPGLADAPDEDRLGNLKELISSAAEFEREFDPDTDPMDADPMNMDHMAEPDDAAAQQPSSTMSVMAMLRAYLESVSLVADADAVDPSQGAVTLMTLHAAKGLEFRAVAMIGLEDGLLPHSRSLESETQLEEERRLCFVGITRAMERLLITSARRRTFAGVSQRSIPSSFLRELPAEHVVTNDLSGDAFETSGQGRHEHYGSQSARSRSLDQSATDPYEADPPHEDEFALPPVGAIVRHPQFGVGSITAIVSGGLDARAQIQFKHVGVKTLVLRYARLERIG